MQCCSRVISSCAPRNLRMIVAGSASMVGMVRSFRLQRAPCSRSLTSDVIPPPTFEGEEKKYPAKIQKLVDEITELTLVEVADLNELLKKTLKLPDVPAMSFSAMPAGKAAEDEDADDAPAQQVKSTFIVRLVKFDDTKKVAVIKEIKSLIEGMNLVQAKKFVESVPQVVRSDVSKEDAEKLKEALTAAGGTVEIE